MHQITAFFSFGAEYSAVDRLSPLKIRTSFSTFGHSGIRAFDAFYPGSFGFWSSIRKLMLHVAGNANLMEHFTNNPTIIDVFISYNPK